MALRKALAAASGHDVSRCWPVEPTPAQQPRTKAPTPPACTQVHLNGPNAREHQDLKVCLTHRVSNTHAGLLQRASGSGVDAGALPAALELAAGGSPARQHRAVLEAARVCLDGDGRAWADFAAWLMGQPAPALQRVFDTFCACVRSHQARHPMNLTLW